MIDAALSRFSWCSSTVIGLYVFPRVFLRTYEALNSRDVWCLRRPPQLRLEGGPGSAGWADCECRSEIRMHYRHREAKRRTHGRTLSLQRSNAGQFHPHCIPAAALPPVPSHSIGAVAARRPTGTHATLRSQWPTPAVSSTTPASSRRSTRPLATRSLCSPRVSGHCGDVHLRPAFGVLRALIAPL